MSTLEDLADRVERLLLRHSELKRTNSLLEQRLVSIGHERDSLKVRLNAARGRIDTMLDRLPKDASVDGPVDPEDASASTPDGAKP